MSEPAVQGTTITVEALESAWRIGPQGYQQRRFWCDTYLVVNIKDGYGAMYHCCLSRGHAGKHIYWIGMD